MAKNKKNLVSSIILQLVTIVSGLIIPRLIISAFGSEINGLVYSITMFLSFITLFEGGIGAVVLAALYKPIEDNNAKIVNRIISECSKFFHKLGFGFILYTIILSIIYPLILHIDLSAKFVGLLVIILGVSTSTQYMFSIKYKLLLQASQRLYVVNIISSISVFINIVLTYVLVEVFSSIHVVKLAASVVFLAQPLVFKWYVETKLGVKIVEEKKVYRDTILTDKRSAFGQNLAHFINMNTDIIVLTLFSTLIDVSVYTVYMLVFTAMRSIIATVQSSYQSVFGQYLARGDNVSLQKGFKDFVSKAWIISIVAFATCMLLINQFVQIYTSGVHDANYYQPCFALIMCIAQFIYVAREPYRLMILAAGKFKETNFGAFLEAVLNIVISVVLVINFGLVGVAVGTLIAIFYRLCYLWRYLKGNIIYVSYADLMPIVSTASIVFLINVMVYLKKSIIVDSALSFVINGFVIVIFNFVLTVVVYFVCVRLKKFIDRRSGKE